MRAQNLNQRQAYQVLYLLRLNFTLKYIPETKIGKVDGLSKRPDWKVGIEKYNKNQVFIKNCQLHNLFKVVINKPEVDIVEKIKKARRKDEEIVRVVKKMKKIGVKVLRGNKW